jgi:hypothetical protein
MCIRELISDPYAFIPSFHECPAVKSCPEVLKFGVRVRTEKQLDPERDITERYSEGDLRFLGDTKANCYDPVCVAWSSVENWSRECGKFWWSPESLGLPILDHVEVNDKRDNEYTRRAGIHGTIGNLGLVPIEYIMV